MKDVLIKIDAEATMVFSLCKLRFNAFNREQGIKINKLLAKANKAALEIKDTDD
jgi:hypothetical protein